MYWRLNSKYFIFHKKILKIIIFSLFNVSMSYANCDMVGNIPGSNGVTPTMDKSAFPKDIEFWLSGLMSGSSEPTGSTLYTAKALNLLQLDFSCKTAIPDYKLDVRVETSPLGIWAGDIGQYSGKIYNSGLQGVGVVITRFDNDSAVPFTVVRPLNTTGATGQFLPGLQFKLIKTGPISPGVIDGSLLPSLVYKLIADDLNIDVFRFKFSGTYTVSQPTCQINNANKTVVLGPWSKNRFSKVGDASSWVDSSITMTCDGPFYGNNGGTYTEISNKDAYNIIVDTSIVGYDNNTWKLNASSSFGYYDAENGIMGLDSTKDDYARGIGIQISSDKINGINFMSGYKGSIDNRANTINIPLYARYIRVGDVVPGSANGKMIYTVSYK